MVDVHQNDNPVYSAATAVIDVYKNGEKLTTLEPERRFYKASQQPLAEIGHAARVERGSLHQLCGDRPGDRQRDAAGLRVSR